MQGVSAPWAGQVGMTSELESPSFCRWAGGPDWAGPGQLTGERRASCKQLFVQVSLAPCLLIVRCHQLSLLLKMVQVLRAAGSARAFGAGPTCCGAFGHVIVKCCPALPSSRSQSAAVTPSSTTSSARATPAPSAPAAASATSPSPAPSSGNGTSTAASPTQPIQLSDLQSILATMNVPAGPGGGQQGNSAPRPQAGG